ncbi:hypothetical protein RQP46_011270 [Phenoliferia psychrophenolica]
MRSSAFLILLTSALGLAQHVPSPRAHTRMERQVRGSLPLSKRSSSTRFVVAHVVMGNWQEYQSVDWINDITLAKRTGIDAFALNCGADASDPTQLSLAYAAAKKVGGFKLFISLDMTYTAKFGSASNIISTYIKPYAAHSAQFKYDNKLVLSTFSGESSGTYLEGNSDINAAWASLISQSGIDIFFVPFWTGLAAATAVSDHPVVAGIGNWLAWPTGDEAPTTSIDLAFQADATKNDKVYIAPVAALFNVHLTGGNNTRMEQIIGMKKVPQMIELLTWFVFSTCESHYLGPIRKNAGLPSDTVNSASYVSDFPHDSLLGLVRVYTKWYKTGVFPSKAVKTSELYYWYRPHPASAIASADPLGKPTNADFTKDYIYVAVVLSPATKVASVRVKIGGTTETTCVSKGKVNLIKVPFVTGTPHFYLLNSASKVISHTAGAPIISTPKIYNFNYYMGTLKE